MDGLAEDDLLGKSVSNAGDVNGHGFDDVIVDAFRADSNGERSGSSYVVFGKTSGFDASLELSSLDGSTGFRLDGSGFNGLNSSDSAGDVNGDGFDDLIVGAPSASPNGFGSGSSYVVFGKASGFAATLDLSNLGSNSGFRLNGVAAGDHLGIAVSGAGDVNHDGFDDLIVGTSKAEVPGRDNSGVIYVVFGNSHFDGTVTYVGTPEDDILTGTPANERFEGGDGNDTLIGGGGADIFQGNAGADVISVSDSGFQILDGGAGTDTLELASGGINLNLANFDDTIKDIEIIDLTGSGDNTLALTLSDLLNLSNTTHILTVNGNAGDRVVGLGSGWADGGIDGNYHTYTNRAAILRVDVAVSINPPPPGVISLSSLNGSNGFRLDGVAGDLSGLSISSAGDVNGDGFDDVIVDASRADPNGPYSGSSYVVFGKASGFAATLDLSNLNGNNGFRLDGVANDFSGESVSDAGGCQW